MNFKTRGGVYSKTLKGILAALLCLTSLTGCGGGQPKYNKVEMATNFQVHKALKINVLSFKIITDNSEIPKMSPAPEGYKYIVIRLILSNPGEHRGLESANFGRIIDKVDLYHPSYEKPFKIEKNSLFENLVNYRSGDRGIAYVDLKPGESKTGWILGMIPKDANPPYTLKLTPSKRVGTVRLMEVVLKGY
ncbi:MAG: hypothetical protein SFU25_04705 [Candidatus Caenarcaniphilales bacterium]|nr:hypothetical protein [Candidatus Caenarcaniphilales bacterium]